MEAAATTKRARSGGGSAAPDRLSALPDELLRRVLSFLPSQEAVRTTVLSKRWVDLWRSVPSIILDNCDFGDRVGCGQGWEKMKDFATNLLMLHNAECLDVFKLSILYIMPVDTRQDADRWIRRAIKYHPLLLDISVPTPCLTRLHQLHFPHLVSSLTRLKKLVLNGLHLDHSFAKHVHFGCPVLEDLVLLNCRNEFPEIQSDTLKNLVVRCCSSKVTDVLRIKASALSTLCIDFPFYNYENGARLEAGHSLVRASISLACSAAPRGGATELLVSLFNVTSLELDEFCATAVLDKELDEFPIFDNLRNLSLNYSFYSDCDLNQFKALGTFLQKAPIVQKLTMKNFWYSEGVQRVEQMVDKPSVKMLPETSSGGKGKAKSKKTNSQGENAMNFQCQKLKYTEIIYKKGGKIPELVSILLDISGTASNNTITLTKF